jgi:hypothetical protein
MRWLAIAVVLAVVGITSLVSMGYVRLFGPIMRFVPADDRVIHFAVMGVMSAAVNLGFAGARPFKGRPGEDRLGIPVVTSFVVLFATLEELSQACFPHRTVSLEDLLAGYLGIALAAVGVMLLRRVWPESD